MAGGGGRQEGEQTKSCSSAHDRGAQPAGQCMRARHAGRAYLAHAGHHLMKTEQLKIGGGSSEQQFCKGPHKSFVKACNAGSIAAAITEVLSTTAMPPFKLIPPSLHLPRVLPG